MALFRIWGPDEQFGTKETLSWGEGGSRFAKLDSRLICLICVYSDSKAHFVKYQKIFTKHTCTYYITQ